MNDIAAQFKQIKKQLEEQAVEAGKKESVYKKYSSRLADQAKDLGQQVAVLDNLQGVVSNTDWVCFATEIGIRRKNAQDVRAKTFQVMVAMLHLHLEDPDGVLWDAAIAAGLSEKQAIELVASVETAGAVEPCLQRLKEVDECEDLAAKRPNADNGQYDAGLNVLKYLIMQANAEGRTQIGRFVYHADKLEDLFKMWTGVGIPQDAPVAAIEPPVDEEDDIEKILSVEPV